MPGRVGRVVGGMAGGNGVGRGQGHAEGRAWLSMVAGRWHAPTPPLHPLPTTLGTRHMPPVPSKTREGIMVVGSVPSA